MQVDGVSAIKPSISLFWIGNKSQQIELNCNLNLGKKIRSSDSLQKKITQFFCLSDAWYSCFSLTRKIVSV